MPEPQDGALVGKPHVPIIQARKLPRYVMQRFFHRRITEREPLLHEMDSQHRLHRKRRASAPSLWRIGHDQRDQRRPRHYTVHIIKKLAFARAFRRQVQYEICLFHAPNPLSLRPNAQALSVCIYADLP